MLTLIREYKVNNGVYGSWLWMGDRLGVSMENANTLIPPAVYGIDWYASPKFGKDVPLLFNESKKVVKGYGKEGERDFIEIHAANFPEELEGCLSGGLNRIRKGVYPSGILIDKVYRLILDNNIVNLEIVEHEEYPDAYTIAET